MKSTAAGLLLALIVVLTTVAGAAQKAPEVPFEKYTLPNGLDVILHQDRSIPMVSVNVWYDVGSGDEKPGRTGFAHLFEHMMFQGSKHADHEYFTPLQAVGAQVNGSTNTDRTNYWENVPSNQLELALWLEADRMGYLLEAMTQEKLDTQIDVVRNERRQNYDNTPYQKAWLRLAEMLYPADHPYSWPTIGYHRDLEAATLEDVSEFFRTYYTPSNASLAIAGDFEVDEARALVEKYFAGIPPGPPVDRVTTWQPVLSGPKRGIAEDEVNLPRVYFAWHTPGNYAPGDAEMDLLANVLAGGKTSRLYRELVYERELAQDVVAFQDSRRMGSMFLVWATAREGVDPAELELAMEGILAGVRSEGVADEELEAARTTWQASFVRRLESVGGFGGIADQLNSYNTYLGDPARFQWDFDRYASATAESVKTAAARYLDGDRRVTLRVVPRGDLAAAAVEVDRSAQPAGGPRPGFLPPSIQRARLDNGLDLLVVEDHSLPLVQMNLVVKSGWTADPAGKPGVAALTAELLDEGTATRTSLDIAAEAKRIAASLRTDSFFDGSSASLNVLRTQLGAGLELLRDVVREPVFPEAELERQRKIYLGRITQEAKQPYAVGLRAFQQALYEEGHPYAQPYTGTGTAASIRAVSRADLQVFFETHYKPNNAALVVAGDLTLEEARAAAERAFGDWQGGEVPRAEVPAAPAVEGLRILLYDRPGAPQSLVIVGQEGIRRGDANELPGEVLNNALGGKFTSRINLNLREDKGYTYGARSSLLAYRDGGMFVALAPVQTDATAASVSELLGELRAVVGDRPLTEDELRDARNNLVQGYPMDFQTVGGIAGKLEELVMYDLPDDEWARRMPAIEGMTVETVNRAAAGILDPEDVVVVVIGDRAQVEAELAKLGPVEVRDPSTLF